MPILCTLYAHSEVYQGATYIQSNIPTAAYWTMLYGRECAPLTHTAWLTEPKRLILLFEYYSIILCNASYSPILVTLYKEQSWYVFRCTIFCTLPSHILHLEPVRYMNKSLFKNMPVTAYFHNSKKKIIINWRSMLPYTCKKCINHVF